MTLKTTFPSSISEEKSKLILNALAKCKASGYTINTQLRKVRQIYHSNLGKDKVDSILAFYVKHNIEHTTVTK